MPGFDVQGARNDGYSDADIADYLASQHKFDLAGARKDGYSDADIISHLSTVQTAPKKATMLSSLDRGVNSLGITVGDLPAYGLEQGARALLGDKLVNDINTFGAQHLGLNPEGAKGTLKLAVADLNSKPQDPTMAAAGQAFDAEKGGFLSKSMAGVGALAQGIYHNPGSLGNIIAEAAPSLAMGGAGGKVVSGMAAPVLSRVVPAAALPLAEAATFGAGMNTAATAAGAGQNVAAQVAQGRPIEEAVNRGVAQTAGELPVAAATGALLPFQPVKVGNRFLRIGGNTAIQTGIQALGGAGQLASGDAAIGEKPTGGELLAAGLGQALFAPIDMAQGALHAAVGERPVAARPVVEPKPAPVAPEIVEAPAALAPKPTEQPRPVELAPRASPEQKPDGAEGYAQSYTVKPIEPPAEPKAAPVAVPERKVYTPTGQEISVRPELVEASSLKHADGDMQNRDRSRLSTDDQVNEIISKFRPEWLGDDNFTDRGAPIVGPDHTIESGNGRVMALNKIYETRPDLAEKYREFIQSQGHDTTGMERPVLIRRRASELAGDDMRAFVTGSNKSDKMDLSAPELARQDSKDILKPEVLAHYSGGELNSAANGKFVSRFMEGVSAGERNRMIEANGRLSETGVQRIENALIAKAYDNDRFLSRAMEQTDDNTRTITGGLAMAAPAWAKFKAGIEAGDILPKYDISNDLAEAADKIAHVKGDGQKIRDFLDQSDAFEQMSPMTRELIKAFHNKTLTRFVSKDRIADTLSRYARLAAEQETTEGLLGPMDAIEPLDLLKQVVGERETEQPHLIAAEDADSTEDFLDDTSGEPGRNQGRRESAPGQDEIEGQDAPEGRQSADRPEAGRQDGGVEDKSGVSSPDKGAYRDTFHEASFTNRQSVYESAVRATGIDEDRFKLLPSPRQKALLAKAFTEKYGIDLQIDGKLQDRFAIDQILDAYQTVQGMAHVLGISERAIGLGGNLSLRLQKGGKFLGLFKPGEREIVLPKRSNSFAHEWSHAIDFHILERTGLPEARGLSAAIRNEGTEFTPRSVSESFTHLIQTMFTDNAGVARRIMELEAKLAEAETPSAKAAIQKQIDTVRAGRSRANEVRSEYYKGALEMNKSGQGDYWTQPTEMFARAFEAYVSHMAETADLGTEFLGKGDANYQSEAETRFAKSFPHADERSRIFEAIGDLMVQLHNEAMIRGDGTAADRPEAGKLRKVTDFDRHVAEEPNGNVIKRQMDEFQRHSRNRADAMEGRAKDSKSTLQRLNDVAAVSLYSMAGKLKMIEGRYKSKAVKAIHDALVYTPGKGEGTPQTFLEDAQATTNRGMNRLTNILKAAQLLDMNKDQRRMLRDLLISEKADNASAPMVKAAANLRTLLDSLFYDAQNAGIDIGYTRNGYLPRIVDMPRVAADEPKFLEKAAEVYGKVFDRDIGPDPAKIADDPEAVDNLITVAKTQGIGHKQLANAAKALKKAIETDGDVAAARAELIDRVKEIFDDARKAFSEDRANSWLMKMKTAADFEREAAAPVNNFTKGRELPPEADKILEDFYLQNPIEAIQSYIGQNARRVAYAKRFGPNGEKMKALAEQMAAEGVQREDADEVMHVADIAIGRARSRISPSAQRFLQAINTYTTMRLLPRAVIASLTEPVTAAMTAGDIGLGFKALASSIVGSNTLKGKERAELARAIGTVTDHGAEALLDQRFGGQFSDDINMSKITSTMFDRTGLTALTRSQRTHTLAASHAYLDLWAGRMLKGDKVAPVILKELGIREPEVFAKELREKGRMPTLEELDTKWGHDYGLASKRFIDMTIQEPNAMMRPQLANNPVGRVIYGITAFSSSFWRNVIKRQANLTAEIYKAAGPARAAGHVALGVMPAALGMIAMQGIVSTLREYLLNPQRWKDLEDSGELSSTMAKLAVTRTFALGLADPFIQAYSGLKYQRSFSNTIVGPGPAVILQDLATMGMVFAKNSSRSNTAEYNATKAAYNAMIAPAIGIGLSFVPGGPLLSPATGLGMAAATSPRAGDAFASAVVGPKERAHGGKPAAGGREKGRDNSSRP